MKKFILSICDHPVLGKLLGVFGRTFHKRTHLMGLRNPFYLSTFVVEREDSHYITNADSYLFLSSPEGARMKFDGSAYEEEVSFLMRKLVRPGDVVLDIGANVGLHTVFLSKLVGEGRGIAFEPVSEMADRLSANCAFNRACNVTLINSALGEEPGEATIQANLGDPGMEGTNSMIASVHVANRPDRYEERTISVKRLDDIAGDLGNGRSLSLEEEYNNVSEPMRAALREALLETQG